MIRKRYIMEAAKKQITYQDATSYNVHVTSKFDISGYDITFSQHAIVTIQTTVVNIHGHARNFA